MIDEPLAPHWRYDLGHRKIFEFRSALGLDGDGPAPPSAVFAYAVVPGLARTLTDRNVAGHRDDLRLSRVEMVFASELDMRGELACKAAVQSGASVVAVISSQDERGARSVATIHLTDDAEHSSPRPLVNASVVAELRVDPARCVAFAAATWDLNPVYWDRELAHAVGLADPIAPPGLPLALALEVLQQRSGRLPSAVDVSFEHAASAGDRLELRTSGDASDLRFEVAAGAGLVLQGSAVLGHEGAAL